LPHRSGIDGFAGNIERESCNKIQNTGSVILEHADVILISSIRKVVFFSDQSKSRERKIPRKDPAAYPGVLYEEKS
jgi:hypothetical protein